METNLPPVMSWEIKQTADSQIQCWVRWKQSYSQEVSCEVLKWKLIPNKREETIIRWKAREWLPTSQELGGPKQPLPYFHRLGHKGTLGFSKETEWMSINIDTWERLTRGCGSCDYDKEEATQLCTHLQWLGLVQAHRAHREACGVIQS